MASKTKKAQRYVVASDFLSVSYFASKVNPVGDTVIVRRDAMRGDPPFELSESEVKRLGALGAIAEEGSAEAELAQSGFTPATATSEEWGEFIMDNDPTIDELAEMAAGDAEIAKRILEGEALATGNDPRVGLTEVMAKIAGQA